VDYRLAENRRESFIKWYAWSIQYKDVDPAVWMTNYLNDRFEHNIEQRLWLAWLYGNTYYLPTTFVLLNEFPDFELATYDRMSQWNTDNYKRLRYQTDTKWSKGHLPDMFKSYAEFVGDREQATAFEEHYGDNEFQTFDNLYDVIKTKFYKFGRYSAWFYLQHLYATCEVPAIPSTLLFNDYSGSRSHRNGFCFAMGKDDWYDKKLEKSEYQWLEDQAQELMIEMRERFPSLTSDINPYTMETCLCSYKKIYRTRHGRYLGYYNDRVSEEIMRVEKDNWNGIEWQVLWDARNETLLPKIAESKSIDKGKMSEFIESGNILRLDWMFSEDKPVSIGLEEFFV
jgi:hypothetical protein